MAILGSDLVAEIRTTSDLQASRFCSDAELLLMANEVMAELYDDLVMAREGYFQTSTVLTLVANASNLPGDFYKEIAVSSGTAPNDTNIPPLESFNDRNACLGPMYWLASRVITIYPTNIPPPAPVVLHYVPNCPVLALSDAMPVDMERYREYIVVGASVKVKTKRAQDASLLVGRMGVLHTRIIKSVTGRKAGPKKVPMPKSEQNYRSGWFDRRYGRYGF